MSKATMMRWLFYSNVALVMVAFSPSQVVAQNSSDEGASFLLLPVGASGVALGRAVTAMPGQESAFWNPAGLASIDQSRLVLLRGEVGGGTSTAASVLFAHPGVGTLGISYLLMDVGGQEHKDSYDNLLGAISVRNHLAVVSAAARLLPGLDAGVNLKVAQFRLSCRGNCEGVGTSSSGFAIDAGLQFVPGDDVPLRLGAMVAHLGPRFQHENAAQADPLPTRVRLAAAYDVLRHLGRADLEGWVTVEVQDRPGHAGGPSFYIGSEFAAGGSDAMFLRAGYATDADQPGGVSMGVGLRFERFEVSVAKSSAMATYAGTKKPFSVSLSVS